MDVVFAVAYTCRHACLPLDDTDRGQQTPLFVHVVHQSWGILHAHMHFDANILEHSQHSKHLCTVSDCQSATPDPEFN